VRGSLTPHTLRPKVSEIVETFGHTFRRGRETRAEPASLLRLVSPLSLSGSACHNKSELPWARKLSVRGMPGR